jgi:hypothetical protein
MAAGSTRIPWIVIGVLIVVLGGASIAAKKKKTDPVKTTGSRAVVVPTVDRSRTVVVPPCNPPTQIDAQNAASQIQVPGAVAVTLLKGAPSHTLVVPRCSTLPSSAFVLAADEQVSAEDTTPNKGNPITGGIKAQVTVPAQSAATTIIVPPCKGKAGTVKTKVLEPLAGTTFAVAPRC